MTDNEHSVNIGRAGGDRTDGERRYHHGDLRAALLREGLALLAGSAGEGPSLREVARAAGVSASAVYRHFPDKAALLRALAADGLRRLAVAQRAAAEGAGGGKQGFAATGRAYVAFALANPALFRLIFSSPAGPGALAGESEAGALLRANAAAAAGPGEDAGVLALRAWSLAHGAAMLLLDGQVAADDRTLDALFGPGLELHTGSPSSSGE